MAKKKESMSAYMYLGPTIRGVVQESTIYYGTLSEILKRLEAAINAYPLIRRLLVPYTEIAFIRQKIKAKANPYSSAYRRLEEK